MIIVYNENIKRQYILDVGSNQKKVERIFHMVTAPFEEIAEKDIAQFTERNVLVMLSKCGYYNIQTIREIMRICRAYCRWCIERRVFCTYVNPFDHIKAEDVNLYETVHRSLVGSLEELVSLISDIHKPESCYVDIPVICFLWMGISFEEMETIRKEDFSPDERTVFIPCSNRTVRRIPTEIAEMLRIYAGTSRVVRVVNDKPAQLLEDPTHQFVRKFVQQKAKINCVPIDRREMSLAVQSFNDDLHTKKRKLDIVISRDSIMQSGLMWRLYDLQSHGLWIGDPYGEFSICEILGKKAISFCSDQLYLYDIYKAVFHGGT